jgi:inward rectifier potassium channel
MVLVVYILIKFVFAGLYSLGGRCIAELPPGSLSDAFFFSVETLATVGYGHMYPDTFYGNGVTTVEIVIGMFGMAVITSRPTARILFSKCAVISPFDGVPTLMLRVASTLRYGEAIEIVCKCNGARIVLTDFRLALLFPAQGTEHPVR